MLGAWRRPRNPQNARFLAKASCISPVDVPPRPPAEPERAAFTPALLSLRPDRDHSSVLGLCPQRALLDERKFRVFFSFLRFLSFPQTKALTVLLASPEEFTEEAGGASSGGAGAAGGSRNPGLPAPGAGLWFQGRSIGRAAPRARQPQARQPRVEAGLDGEPGGGGAGRERGWHWPLRPQFERGCSLVLCFGGILGRGVPRPEVLWRGLRGRDGKARCRPGPRAGLATLPLSQDLGLFALLAMGPLSCGRGSRVPSTGRSLSKGGRRQPFQAGALPGGGASAPFCCLPGRSALPGSRGLKGTGVTWPRPGLGVSWPAWGLCFPSLWPSSMEPLRAARSDPDSEQGAEGVVGHGVCGCPGLCVDTRQQPPSAHSTPGSAQSSAGHGSTFCRGRPRRVKGEPWARCLNAVVSLTAVPPWLSVFSSGQGQHSRCTNDAMLSAWEMLTPHRLSP